MSTERKVSHCTAIAIALLIGLGSASPVDAQIWGQKDACGCPTCPPHFFWKHKEQPYGRPCDCEPPCATECSGPPTGPFFGYYPTCWHRWPNGFQNCPVTDWEARGDGCGLPMEGQDMIGPPVPYEGAIVPPTQSIIGGQVASPVLQLGERQSSDVHRFAASAARLPNVEPLVLEQVPAAAVATAWESNEPRRTEFRQEIVQREAYAQPTAEPAAVDSQMPPEAELMADEPAPAIVQPKTPLTSTKGKTLREIIAERRGKQPVRELKPQNVESVPVQPFTAIDAKPALELESRPPVETKSKSVLARKKSRAKVAYEPEVAETAPARSNGLRSAQLPDRVNPLRR